VWTARANYIPKAHQDVYRRKQHRQVEGSDINRHGYSPGEQVSHKTNDSENRHRCRALHDALQLCITWLAGLAHFEISDGARTAQNT
jgi:hypothetical protein